MFHLSGCDLLCSMSVSERQLHTTSRAVWVVLTCVLSVGYMGIKFETNMNRKQFDKWGKGKILSLYLVYGWSRNHFLSAHASLLLSHLFPILLCHSLFRRLLASFPLLHLSCWASWGSKPFCFLDLLLLSYSLHTFFSSFLLISSLLGWCDSDGCDWHWIHLNSAAKQINCSSTFLCQYHCFTLISPVFVLCTFVSVC